MAALQTCAQGALPPAGNPAKQQRTATSLPAASISRPIVKHTAQPAPAAPRSAC